MPKHWNLSLEKFEKAIEFLEGNCVGHVPRLDELESRSIVASHQAEAIYDFWLDKRLANKTPLVFQLKKEIKPRRGVNTKKYLKKKSELPCGN